MSSRKDFKEIKDFQEFASYYWYREELVTLCKELGICHTGDKIELYSYIEQYFLGIRIPPKRVERVKVKESIELNSSTSIVASGFCFNQHFREWFIQETGNPKFKFHADMVASVKKAKELRDMSFTLGDLLDIFYGRKTYASYDKSFCQWNQFLKDFCNDSYTAGYKNKLKAASILWVKLRDSTEDKVYKREYLIKNKDLLKNLL